ncbi:MAG TPA: D-alanyl-D-alanine carboxypeptidase family protein [Burkholderiales bacterium]
MALGQTAAPLPVPPPPAAAARAYVLYDVASGQTLASQNPAERVEPASLTKLMTAYLTFSALKQGRIKLDQAVPVSPRAWKAEGSRMFIEPNKPVTVDELIRGMIVQSGNDACIALAEAIAGSEEVFAQMMNREAARLGMKNTSFMNSTGLPNPQHYTTAQDLTLLVSALIRDFPEYYPIYSQKEFTYNKITQANRNRLLWLDPTVDGVKTGYTEAAGWCLITSSRRGDRRLISVVLGAPSENARVTENQKLLNYGFQFYDAVRLYQKGQAVATLEVWKGAEKQLKAGFNQDLWLSVPKGAGDRLQASIERQQPLVAPVSAGQRVGTVKLSLDGKPLGEYPLLALEQVAIASFFGRAWDSLRLWFK